jgi:GT2 family glycosyltransferase
MKRIGAVVVTHNSEPEIGRCLGALPPGIETVVVDNASSDGTCQQVLDRPGVRLFANPWNRGFAAAANQGIAALDTECVLLLNPDVELESGLDALADACAGEGVAAASARLVDGRGRPQTGFMVRRLPTPRTLAFEVLGINRIWPGNPVNRRYRCLDLDPGAEAVVEQPAGALLMIRREVWRRLGGFDESFFPVWFEDVDFAKRAAEAGYVMRYVPSSVARHSGGHSVGRLSWAARERYWYGNLLTYAAKHFARSDVLAVCAALVLGSLFRMAFWMVRQRSLKPFLSYAGVVRLAGACVVSGSGTRPGFSSALAVQ